MVMDRGQGHVPELPHVVESTYYHDSVSSRVYIANEAYPNLVVQMPIMPQSGMKIVTTLVTTNCNGLF